jgi:hypothetical protein
MLSSEMGPGKPLGEELEEGEDMGTSGANEQERERDELGWLDWAGLGWAGLACVSRHD